MNVENLRKLRDHLEAVEAGRVNARFDMSVYLSFPGKQSRLTGKAGAVRMMGGAERLLNDCGTAGCLAGHATLLAMLEEPDKWPHDAAAHEIAREWLGLSEDRAEALFMPELRVRLDEVTVADAIIWLGDMIREAEI